MKTPSVIADLTTEEIREIASQGQSASSRVAEGGFIAKAVVFTPGGQPIEVQATIGRINPPSGQGRARNAQFDGLRASMENRHRATGIDPATILNFSPIPLIVNSPMTELRVRIKPAPAAGAGSDLFSFHTWHNPSIEVMQLGDNISQPWDYMPIQLAQAFMDEYREMGGVVMFKGIPDEETLARPDVVAMIAEARETMYVWMRTKVEEANAEWNSPNHQGAKNIVTLHRECALCLKEQGLIDNMPEWVTEARKLTDVAKKCPSCALLPAIGAVRCACGYILDPAKAYLIGDINEEDASLERLTRLEVEELGISAYVSETRDERPQRLKSGGAKPMSRAQYSAMQVEQGQGEPAAL